MNKKKGIKLGVCSLLVGLLALTACKKKTTTVKPTTITPTTKTTTDKTSSKTTNKTTTKVTTEDKSVIVRLDVYIGNQKISDSFNEVDVTYGSEYDLESLVLVRGVKDNNSEVVITDFDVETNLTPTSNVGTYDVTISYENLTPVTFSVKVNPKEIDAATLVWDYTEAPTYDSEAKSVALKNVPTGLVVSYTTNGEAGNSATNACNYNTVALLSVESDNYKIINNDEPISLDWEIKKAKRELEGIVYEDVEVTYTGYELVAEITDSLPTGVTVSYEGAAINAGEYTNKAIFSCEDTNYYIEPMTAKLTIKKANFISAEVIGLVATYDGESKNVVKEKSAQTVNNQPVSWLFSKDGENWYSDLYAKEANDSGTYYYKATAPNHNDATGTFTILISEKEIPSLEITNLASLTRQYDGNRTGALTSTNSEGTIEVLYSGDEGITWSSEAPKFVGNYTVKVTLGETDDYAGLTITKKFIISHKILTVSGIVVDNKIYDGKTTATISNYGTLNGIIDGETVEIDGSCATAKFADSNVGENKAVVIMGYIISGEDSLNYELDGVLLQATASITNATITNIEVTGYNADYDGESHNIVTSKNATFVGDNEPIWEFSVDGENWVSELTVKDVSDSGTYYYKVSAANHNDVVNTFTVTISKGTIDVSNLTWNYDSDNPFIYDKTTHTVTINSLPNGITSVNYIDNSKVNAGEYTAKATFEYDEDNYNLVGATEGYIELEWDILQAQSRVIEFSVESKTYDGSACSVIDNVVTDGDVYILYGPQDADDDEYTTEAPVDAGYYTARIYVENNINYADLEEEYIVNFYILKKAAKKVVANNNTFVTLKTGAEQTLEIPGYDPNIHYLMRGSNVEESIKATDVGSYTFGLYLKDPKNYYWEGYNQNTTSYFQFTWIITDNYFTEIKINGKEKTYDELVNYIFAKNETVKLTVAEGYTAIIKKSGNSVAVASGQSIEYSVLYSDNILDFYVQQGSTNVWYQRYNIGNGYIKKLEVNGNVYNTGVNNAYIELNANDTELNIELLDYDDNYDYSIYYDDGMAQKRAEFVNGKLIEQINITGSKKIYINARSKETQSNYAGILILYVKEFNPIETLSVSSYNLHNGTLYDHDVAQSEYSNEYYIYPEMYAGSQQMGNSIVTGINLAFKEGYEDCTFEIVDAYTLEEHDFTKIKQDTDVYIHIYRDGKIIYKTDAIIYNKVAYLIDSDSYYNLGKEIAFYQTFKGDELEFDFKLEDSKYIYGDYKVLLNGIESMYKTYDNEGVYTEKITLLFDVYGVTYTQEVDCDVICSDYLDDFGIFCIYSRYEGYSYENETYVENNIFETEFDIYSYTHLREDWLYYEIDDNLEFVSKEFYFINVDDSENRRLILKITLSYEGTNYSLYTICTLNENFMSSTDIADEKIWRTNVYNLNDGYIGYKIEDDIITVTDATKGDYVELDFLGFVNALVYKDDEIIAGRSEKYVDWIRFRLEEAGEYKLVINDLFGNERIVTINVSGNFNNVIEATIGNSTLFFNELDSDNIKKRVGAEGAVISVGYFGSSAASYIDEGKVEVTLSGVALGYIYKDDNLEELITTSLTTFTVLYDNDNKPYISIFIGNDYTQKELILYLTDKPANVVTIDFGNNQEYHFFGDEYGFDGDFTEFGDGTNYILEVDSIGESFTLTTDQVYSDYSYAVIMAPINFLMIGLYDGDYSLEELEEMGYLYRVTDTTTKSVTIPLMSPTIYILNLGTYELDWNMISYFILTKCNIFSAKTEDKEFYAVLSQSADAMLYEDANYKLETNADATYESTSMLGGASFAAYYEFCLGAEEKKNIITIGGEKYYKFKIHSGLGLTIYDDWYSTNELVPDEDGYIYLLVRGYGLGDYCEFYLDGYILNEKIGVSFDFLDRIPKPGTQIVGEAISKSNLVLSNKEYAINESDAVTINDWNPADNYTIEFKELVNVVLYNDNDDTLVYESEDLTDKITVKFDKPGTYVLGITDIQYNERDVVITVSDSEGGVPILGVPTTNGINVFDDDSSTQYGFFKRDNGYVTYLGSDIAEYVSSENTLLMPIVGYGADYLYTDLALEHKLELNDDDSVLVNVLTDDNDKLYILLYLDTINGALPIRIYLVDRTLSGTTVTIGDKTYNIGTSPDDLGDLIHYLDLNDFDCYSLTHRGRANTITFNYDTLYDDYSYAIICADYQTSLYNLINSGASFEDLENMGLLFTTKDKDHLSFTYTIKENIDYPIYFYVVPYGAKSIHDFNIYDDFRFEIQLDYTLFDITIGDKNYYASNYTDWTDIDRDSEFDSNADEAIYNDYYDYYEGLVYCIGEAEESNIVEGTYTFKMDSNFVDVFYLDKRLENSLAINDGYVTLTVKEKDGIKYVDFYYGVTFTGTCNVTLMFVDELPE